ncbi:MAG: sulfotransferase [Candidatus Scalindua sp.]
MQNYRYIFITGPGRCGTTLTRCLIDGHSKINTLPGEMTNFLGVFLEESGYSRTLNIRNNIGDVLGQFLHLFSRDTDYKYYEKKINLRIKELINKGKFSLTVNQLFNYLCDAIYDNENSIVLVDVTNENISGLLDEFPGSKVIHLLRHPMEQLNSHYRFRYKDPNVLRYSDGQSPVSTATWEFGELFYRIYKSFREVNRNKNNPNVLIVKLENLQKKTEATLDKVFQFIGVNIEDINYKITRRGQIIDAGSTQTRSTKIFVSESDWSCLTSNDLYYLGKLSKLVSDYYDIPAFKFRKNKYSTFLLRQAGLIGKNRKLVKKPRAFARLIITSFSQYKQDEYKKNHFENILKKNND